MLHSHEFRDGSGWNQLYTFVTDAENLPSLLQFWMAHVARDLLRLGVYFRAVALLSELPGGTRYQPLIYDAVDPRGLDDEDHPRDWLGRVDHKVVLEVLAECLRRMERTDFLKRVPGGADYEPQELPEKWTACLDRHADLNHGLLSVVAACLHELIVEPEWRAIDTGSGGTWWQEWWSCMKE